MSKMMMRCDGYTKKCGSKGCGHKGNHKHSIGCDLTDCPCFDRKAKCIPVKSTPKAITEKKFRKFKIKVMVWNEFKRDWAPASREDLGQINILSSSERTFTPVFKDRYNTVEMLLYYRVSGNHGYQWDRFSHKQKVK